MADITDLPVMSCADAVSVGFAGFNDVAQKPIDVPDGAFTITAKTSEGRRVTFCFLEKTHGGPPRFIDIQFHDRGTTIPNADNGVSPTFNSFAITRGRRFVADSRPLDEDTKPSILVLLLDRAGEEPAQPAPRDPPMKDRDLADLLDRAAAVIADPDSEIRSHRDELVDALRGRGREAPPAPAGIMSTASRGDGMHVAHTATGWVVFDNSLAHPSRLSAAFPSRAAAETRKRALARALRHQRPHDPTDA